MRAQNAVQVKTKSSGAPQRTGGAAAKGGRATAQLSTAEIVQRAQADPSHVSPAEVLHMQQTVGNRAVQRLLGERAPDAGAQPAVGAASLREAMERNSAPELVGSGGAAGGPLATPLQRDIRDAAQAGGQALDAGAGERMGVALGANLHGVRVHADARADRLSRSLNADAFTLGGDMFFRRGKYSPGSAAGQKLIAHEAVHVVQQGGVRLNKARPGQAGAVQTKLTVGSASDLYEQEAERVAGQIMRPAAPRTVRLPETHDAPTTDIAHQHHGAAVQRKLAGTAAMLSQEPPDAADEEWSEIVAGLQQYEKYEKAFVAQSEREELSEDRSSAWRRTLLDVLLPLQHSVKTWLGAHKVDAQAYYKKPGDPVYRRRTVLENVRARLANEKLELVSGSFVSTRSPALSVTKAGAAAGNVNSVDQVDWGGGQAFFKADAPTEDNPAKGSTNPRLIVEKGARIKPHSPRTSARSVAMYKIDQLLETNVLVRTSFAISGEGGNAKFGQVMEKAEGETGFDTATTSDASILADPVLQRGLNKLQMLDALCGQVDRHMKNYYVQKDKAGKVIGVKGIDNDLAFGRGIDLHQLNTNAYFYMKYKGMPPIVDKQTAENILKLTPWDIEKAVAGLLSRTDIAETIERLVKMQAKLREMETQGLFIENWGAEMAETTSQGHNPDDINQMQPESAFAPDTVETQTVPYMKQFAAKVRR